MQKEPEFVYTGQFRLNEKEEKFLSDLVKLCKHHNFNLFGRHPNFCAKNVKTGEKITDISVMKHSCTEEFVLNCQANDDDFFDVDEQLDIYF